MKFAIKIEPSEMKKNPAFLKIDPTELVQVKS
jgi:hypothetical protein